MARDIESLLHLGRQKGPGALLHERLEYLWQTCCGELSQQSDLLRLTHAIKTLKSQGWINAVVADDEWTPETLYAGYADVAALLVRKSELQRHFTEEGQQSAPVDFIVVGDSRRVGDVFDAGALRYMRREQNTGWCILTLVPSTTD